LRIPAAAPPRALRGAPRDAAHRTGRRDRQRHPQPAPDRDAAHARHPGRDGRRRPGGPAAHPRDRRGRAAPSHPRPVRPDADRTGAGRRLRPGGAGRPGAGRHGRGPGRGHLDPGPDPRSGVRADRSRPRTDAPAGAAAAAFADPDRDARAVSAGTSGGGVRLVLALLSAVVCAAAIWALAHFAVGTASGQRLDQLTVSGALAHEGQLAQVAALVVTTVRVPVVAGMLAVAALLVVLRRARLLLPLGVLVVGANRTTQAVKPLAINREVLGPGIDVTPNSFPSGHTTLAAS